jgi:hypothetical protein
MNALANDYMAYFRITAGPANDIFLVDTLEQALELAREASAIPANSGFLLHRGLSRWGRKLRAKQQLRNRIMRCVEISSGPVLWIPRADFRR